jgi:hypothetical protein
MQLLNRAITNGHMPVDDLGIGPDTCAAIAAIAGDHPEATPELIADAYDAFAREHG